MRTICIGRIPDRQRDMFQACHEALLASMAALKPGEPIGQVFDAHARILDQAGFQDHRLNACGYSLGALYHPNWMDWPMFYTGNPELAAPNMVFFLHMILADSDAGLASGNDTRPNRAGDSNRLRIAVACTARAY